MVGLKLCANHPLPTQSLVPLVSVVTSLRPFVTVNFVEPALIPFLSDLSGEAEARARLSVSPLQHIWAGRLCMSMVMPSSSTSPSCCFPSRFPSSLYFLAALHGRCWLLLHRCLLAGSHYGLRTRRGVPPPCARVPTFQPRTSPLRSSLRPLRVSTRLRCIPLLGRRHRSWCHAFLACLALFRFVTSHNIQARRTCFPYSARTRIAFRSTFLFSSTQGFSLIACTTCFVVEHKDAYLTVATRQLFEGRGLPVIHLVSLELPKAQRAFRRLCMDCEVVFYRRELNRVFKTVGDAHSTSRFPSQHLSKVSALFHPLVPL